MSITVSLLQDGTNSHKETVDKFNEWATKLFSSDGIVPNGSIVNATPDTGDFALQANGTPDMNLDVLAGSALVTGTPTSGVSQRVLVVNSATIDDGITIAANSTGGTRYDWIYIKLDPDKMKDPASGADDVATIFTSRSTSSTTDDGTPPTYGLNIAVVTVANGATTIANSAITDARVFAGQPIAVSDIRQTSQSAWQSWTPTWTNLTAGNGTVTARYMQIGKTVFYILKFVLGSSSAIGTSPNFSLPVTAKTGAPWDIGSSHIGTTYILDSAADELTGFVLLDSATVASPTYGATAASALQMRRLSATVPMTWTTNDKFICTGFYEAA